jgi:hypothetical protein
MDYIIQIQAYRQEKEGRNIKKIEIKRANSNIFLILITSGHKILSFGLTKLSSSNKSNVGSVVSLDIMPMIVLTMKRLGKVKANFQNKEPKKYKKRKG